MAQVKKQGSPKKKSVGRKSKSIPAKKPVAPKQSKGLFGLSRSQTVLLIWVLVICSLLISGYKLIVLPEQQKNDRIAAEQQRFEEGQKLIDYMAAKAAQQFPPTEKKAENSCRYKSQKFGNGPLRCTVQQSLIYRDISVDEANRIMLGINNITGNKPLRNWSTNQEGGRFFDGTNKNNRFLGKLNQLQDFCSASFDYPAEYQSADSFKFGKNDMLVNIACSQPASKEFYPTTNKNY